MDSEWEWVCGALSLRLVRRVGLLCLEVEAGQWCLEFEFGKETPNEEAK